MLFWSFVVVSGVAVGAGLYETRVNVPRWFQRAGEGRVRVDAPAMRSDDSGRRFWAFVTTVPLTLLTLASLAAAWNAPGPKALWWRIAAGVILVERIGTLTYFIPRGLRLLRAEAMPPGTVEPMARQWMRLNYVRAALALAGWLAALRALSLPQ
jgi:hypothetical protein